MFDWAIGGLGTLFGFVGNAVDGTVGWAWDKVVQGIYTWLANGLALLIEWVWSVLDSGTSPQLTADWFHNDLAARVGLLALAVTVAMMLASATQAALAGRPEQIGDAVKEGVRAILAAAVTVTVVDVLIGVVDEAAELVWQTGRADLVAMLEGVVVVATTSGPLGSTFVGPLCLLFGFVGLLGLVVALLMRSALIYVAAALAPLVWSANVLPLFRGSARKLVHLLVALVVSKLAIVVALVVAVKLAANPSGDPATAALVNDGAAAVGTLLAGFVCFLIAAVTPVVLYRLMPTVESAVVGAGVAGGWVRGATTTAHTGLMVKSLGATAGASAANKAVAGQGLARGATTTGATSDPEPQARPRAGGVNRLASEPAPVPPQSAPPGPGGGGAGDRGGAEPSHSSGGPPPPQQPPTPRRRPHAPDGRSEQIEP